VIICWLVDFVGDQMAGRDSGPLFGVPTIIIVVLGVAWYVLHRQAVRRHAAQMQVWAAEMHAWEQRMYCGRCDATFEPWPAASAYTGQTMRIAS